MVYSWDILTDKRRDIFSRQYITSYEGYRIPASQGPTQATLKFRSCNKEHSCSLESVLALDAMGWSVPPHVPEACKDINCNNEYVNWI